MNKDEEDKNENKNRINNSRKLQTISFDTNFTNIYENTALLIRVIMNDLPKIDITDSLRFKVSLPLIIRYVYTRLTEK